MTVWKWWPGEVGEGLWKRLCSRCNDLHLTNERIIGKDWLLFGLFISCCISSSLTLIWHHFGIKNGASGGPRSSLSELGSNFLEVWWRREAKQVITRCWDHSFLAVLVLQDAPRWFSRNYGTFHNGHIWYKPCLGPPKKESHNELRQGAKILIEIWSSLGRFQWSKSWILHWFYNSFSDFGISQHWLNNC